MDDIDYCHECGCCETDPDMCVYCPLNPDMRPWVDDD